MDVLIKYDMFDGNFCCKNKKDKCDNLLWGRGNCTVFNAKPKWDYDQLAFRKIQKCKDLCEMTEIQRKLTNFIL